MKGTSIMWDYIREEQAALSRMLDDKALSAPDPFLRWMQSILWPMAVPLTALW